VSGSTPETIAARTVVFDLPGTEAVTVRPDVEYGPAGDGALTLDVYHPPGRPDGERVPAVLFVTGYADAGMQKVLGCRFKDMGSAVSWARLTAACGVAAITYANREPSSDLTAVLSYVRRNGPSLGVDGDRVGVWACSGHVPTALSLLMQESTAFLKCAVLCYGYTLDIDGSTLVADAARTFGFFNACAGKSVEALPRALPLFVARAGRDECPGLNAALDRFLVHALARNLAVTLVNHPEGPHAFDLFHDSEPTRVIIRQILAFMTDHLRAATRHPPRAPSSDRAPASGVP
jgi:hypothetical protein